MFRDIQLELRKKANKQKSIVLQRFFKTGKGQYGEGDIFLGVIVPEQRKIAKKYPAIDFADLQKLLDSKIHEERLTAVLILVQKYLKSEIDLEKDEIYNFYLRNTKNINNWDLVDLSADKIIGSYLEKRDKNILQKLAFSKNIWERRIAIMSTFYFIKQGQSKETLEIARRLLRDEHDLIQKAVGWMLREIGKRCSLKEEEDFLKKYYKQMPRTMLRYAVERFAPEKKMAYLKGKI